STQPFPWFATTSPPILQQQHTILHLQYSKKKKEDYDVTQPKHCSKTLYSSLSSLDCTTAETNELPTASIATICIIPKPAFLFRLPSESPSAVQGNNSTIAAFKPSTQRWVCTLLPPSSLAQSNNRKRSCRQYP
ncbi:hypothetical protein Tcan_00955, partial [Toxocara canis]